MNWFSCLETPILNLNLKSFCRHLGGRLCGREQAVSTGEPSDHTAGLLFFFVAFSSVQMIITPQLAVEAEATEFVSELLRHPRTDPNLPDQVTLSNLANTLISKQSL